MLQRPARPWITFGAEFPKRFRNKPPVRGAFAQVDTNPKPLERQVEPARFFGEFDVIDAARSRAAWRGQELRFAKLLCQIDIDEALDSSSRLRKVDPSGPNS